MLYRERTLSTQHGSVNTPILFPVRNIGTRSQDNTPEYIGEIPDLPTAMVNARAIRERESQWERLKQGADFRDELGAPDDAIIFADSGGFQFQEGPGAVDTTPTETLRTQEEIDADIYGTVDVPLSEECGPDERKRRIERSTDYALEASDQHSGDSLLFASVHGYDPEIIQNTLKYLDRQGDFDGFALGSLVPIGGQYERVTSIILAARKATDKHLHVYGLGGFLYLPLLLYLGVDSFDSSAFIRSASHRRYLVPGFRGEILRNISELEYLPCGCPVCRDRPLDDVRSDRNLLVQHNLWALTIELRRFRYAAASDRDIESYLRLRYQGNDVTLRAFKTAKQQVRGLA